MTILEQIEQRSSALKVNELAEMLRVTPQHIYRLTIAPFEMRYQSPAPIRISSLPSSVVLIMWRVPWLGTSRSSSAKYFMRYSATSVI